MKHKFKKGDIVYLKGPQKKDMAAQPGARAKVYGIDELNAGPTVLVDWLDDLAKGDGGIQHNGDYYESNFTKVRPREAIAPKPTKVTPKQLNGFLAVPRIRPG